MKKNKRSLNGERKTNVGGNEKTERKKSERILRIVGITFICILAAGLLTAGGLALGFKLWANDVDFDAKLLPTAKAVPVFLDANGGKIDYIDDNYVKPNEIPDNVKAAFVALEDKRFYSHKGYDLRGMARAVLTNIKAGKAVEGASTITQQLVKNTHLSSEKTLSRKLKEIAIAVKIEENFSKDEILAMYLSVIYFGGGAYGINAASKLYFGCAPDELTVAQAATLAGILKNPSRYSPRNSIENARNRRNLVLDVMRNEGYITDKQCEAAKNEKLKIVNRDASAASYAEFYVDRAVAEVCRVLGITKYQLNNSGLTIFTAMQPDLQQSLGEKTADRSAYSADYVSGAALILDNYTGEIAAHYGTLDYEISRQAGSALKPITVYAPALDCGAITLATPVTDELTDFNGYRPENFGGRYYGLTNPREAVKKSMNTVAVKVLSYTGIDNAAEYARKSGLNLTEGDKNLALALGATSEGINPAVLAGAYSVFARGGEYIKPHYVRAISNGGDKIYSADTSLRRVCSAETAYLMTDCLADTVKDGTAKSLSALPFAVAGKTGTVQKNGEYNSDAWSVSYTRDYTLAVWHGAESMTELGGGHATKHAASVWRGVYRSDRRPARFARPSGVVEAEIDVYSTELNKKVTLAVPATPDVYRRKELFSMKYLPDSGGSRFTDPVPEFSVSALSSGEVSAEIKISSAFDYTVLCTDLFGTRIVAEIDGALAGDGVENVKFRPFAPSGRADITVQMALAGGDGTIIGGDTKSVYLSFPHPLGFGT